MLGRTKASTACALIASVILLVGCAPPERPAGTVVYASGSDLESANPLVTIHPLSRQIQRHALFVTLARFDSALVPVPYAARSWSWSRDMRTLTFQLDPTIRWHDGRPTTAADVRFTLDAARDPRTGYLRASDLAGIAELAVLDDWTLAVYFEDPQPSFPLVLCELPILPRHLLASVLRSEMRRAEFNVAPVGNGPFRFVRRVAGQRWEFARNPDFPLSLGGPPLIERLIVAVVDEPTTKFAGLVSGELDVAGIPPTMATLARGDQALDVIDYPVLFSYALAFNPSRPPFDDARVRRAVSLSLDRERIIQTALAGYALAARGPVPPDHPLSAASGVARDTLLADALLDSAGWRRISGGRARDGMRLSFELATVGSGDNAAEQLIQADLDARGIDVSIRQLELGAFLAMARAPRKEFDAIITGIPGDLSLSFLGAMYEGAQAGGSLDYSGFHTPRLDSLLASARKAGVAADAKPLWIAVQGELEREMPAAWIYHARGVQGISRRLRGVRMDLRGELATLTRWTVGDDRVAGAP